MQGVNSASEDRQRRRDLIQCMRETADQDVWGKKTGGAQQIAGENTVFYIPGLLMTLSYSLYFNKEVFFLKH